MFFNIFIQNIFRMTSKLLWDLPAIISTICLNCGLINELLTKEDEPDAETQAQVYYENELENSFDYENVKFSESFVINSEGQMSPNFVLSP